MNKEFEEAKRIIFNNEEAKNPDPLFKNSKKIMEALLSYKKVVGIEADQPFEDYCSACCPVWFDKKCYGVGPNPNPTPGVGLWHGEWERRKFPLGYIETDDVGNMRYTDTKKPVRIKDGELM
jgi:hypothetical protein